MIHKILSTLLSFFLLCGSVPSYAENPFTKLTNNNGMGSANHQYLPMDQAFKLTPTFNEQNQVVLSWVISPHYYLFKNSIQIKSDQLLFNIPALPEGQEKTDEILGTYQVYIDVLTVPVSLKPGSPTQGTFTVSYQGCAKAGFCYPPTTKGWRVDFTTKTISLLGSETTPSNSVTNLMTVENDTAHIQSFFDHYSTPVVLVLFFGLGLLLSFTPCVLPMIPIIAAILVGQGQSLTRQRAFTLSFTYWLSTSLTYCAAGVVTALAGKSVQSFLQNPWVVGFTAVILILLALSLFGLYELRLPQRFEQKIQQLSQKQRRGTFVGVAMMGILSALVVSPCITAPLLGALTYIATTGNAVLGGLALFLLGLGMGFPLFLIGTFGISLLPKAGNWMRYVQYFLGILLIGLAFYLIRPFFFTHDTLGNAATHQTINPIVYTRVHSMTELDAELAKAKQAHKPVMIDFYADWCTSCLLLEHTVFNDPQVIALLKQFVVLRVDVTQSTPQTDEIQVNFMAFAPPAFIFFDKAGNEVPKAEIVGEAPAKKFIETFESMVK